MEDVRAREWVKAESESRVASSSFKVDESSGSSRSETVGDGGSVIRGSC
jgi:hypothetical protein